MYVNTWLNGKPFVWDTYTDVVKNKNLDIRAPYVSYKGNCSLEEATSNLRNMLKNYI